MEISCSQENLYVFFFFILASCCSLLEHVFFVLGSGLLGNLIFFHHLFTSVIIYVLIPGYAGLKPLVQFLMQISMF